MHAYINWWNRLSCSAAAAGSGSRKSSELGRAFGRPCMVNESHTKSGERKNKVKSGKKQESEEKIVIKRENLFCLQNEQVKPLGESFSNYKSKLTN